MTDALGIPFLIQHSGGANVVSTFGLISRTGEILVPPDCDDIDYFFEGLAAMRRGPRRGFVDTRGREVIAPRYELTSHFQDGWCAVYARGRWMYVDRSGRELVPAPFKYAGDFSEGLAAIANDNHKWGFIDAEGRLVIPHAFDDAGGFSEGVCAVKTKKGWGFIDRTGAFVVEPRFKRAWGMKDGRAQVVSSGKEPRDALTELLGAHQDGGEFKGLWGIVDREGHYVVAPRFTYSESALAISATVQRRFTGPSGTMKIQPVVEGASPLVDGHYRIKTKRGFGYVDADGNLVAAGPFVHAGVASEGHAFVERAYGEGYRLLSIADGVARDMHFDDAMCGGGVSPSDDVSHFSEGLAPAALAQRWGYVDPRGAWVIAPRFRAAWPFENGLARVIDDGVTAYVDREGTRIWPRG